MCLYLHSILAEQFLTSHDRYEQEAKKHTQETAGQPLDELEKVNEQWCFKNYNVPCTRTLSRPRLEMEKGAQVGWGVIGQETGAGLFLLKSLFDQKWCWTDKEKQRNKITIQQNNLLLHNIHPSVVQTHTQITMFL